MSRDRSHLPVEAYSPECMDVEFSEVQLSDEERLRVKRVISSSSCSQHPLIELVLPPRCFASTNPRNSGALGQQRGLLMSS